MRSNFDPAEDTAPDAGEYWENYVDVSAELAAARAAVEADKAKEAARVAAWEADRTRLPW
jgi:hypothetical protein